MSLDRVKIFALASSSTQYADIFIWKERHTIRHAITYNMDTKQQKREIIEGRTVSNKSLG